MDGSGHATYHGVLAHSRRVTIKLPTLGTAVLATIASLSIGCAAGADDPAQEPLESVTGQATFYADRFEGRRTASGIPFRQTEMVAAHRAYPFGTVLRVTNLSNDRSVTVRVVDRGPFGATARARRTIIDLSRRAAEQLGFIEAGRAPVRVDVLEWGDE